MNPKKIHEKLVIALLLLFSFAVSASTETASSFDKIPTFGGPSSAAYDFGNGLFPFVRFVHPDGGAGVAAEDAFSLGAQIAVRSHRFWSLGAGWVRPSEQTFGPGLDDETVLETSYKVQLSKNF